MKQVKKLIEMLKDPGAVIRQEAAYALGKIGPAASAAVPALTAALKDPDSFVRREVAWALGWIQNSGATPAEGGDDMKQVKKLIEMPKDPNPNAEVRESAAYALGDIGPEAAATAVTVLTTLLKDPDADVRGCAARALRRIEKASVKPTEGETT